MGIARRSTTFTSIKARSFCSSAVDELTHFTLRAVAIFDEPEPMPGGRHPSVYGGRNEPRECGARVGEIALGDARTRGGMERPEEYDPSDYEFIPARIEDNPIYAGDTDYKRTLGSLPGDLKRAFLDGSWDVFAGQYFDRFDVRKSVRRAETVEVEAVVAAMGFRSTGDSSILRRRIGMRRHREGMRAWRMA